MNSNTVSKKILLASPRGFCAGVSRAIAIVEKVLEKYNNDTVYVLHEVVHNRHVVENLTNKGIVFVEDINEVPNESIIIFSAHGVSAKVEQIAKDKKLKVFDATCPIVDRVHRKVRRLSKDGHDVIMIGHAGHQEVEGTLGQYTNPNGKICLIVNSDDIESLPKLKEENLNFVTQTTLSVDETKECIEALQQKFSTIEKPNINDICYATQNRQLAVKTVASMADLVLVVGSQNSSNSKRLSEVAASVGCKSYLIDDYTNIKPNMLENVNTIAITGGASAPEYLVNDLIEYLKSQGYGDIEEIGSDNEKQNFKMPSELI